MDSRGAKFWPADVSLREIQYLAGQTLLAAAETKRAVRSLVNCDVQWWFPARKMGVSKIDGLYKGKSHLEMDDLEVALFQEPPKWTSFG